MKEYLVKRDGEYVLVNAAHMDDAIEVPEGAIKLTKGIKQRVFWNKDGHSFNIDDKSIGFSKFDSFDIYMENFKDTVKVLWQRTQKPQQEYLNKTSEGWKLIVLEGGQTEDENLIRVPDGAEWAKLWDHGEAYEYVEFYKGKNYFFSVTKNEWLRGSDQSKNMIGQPAKIIWKRHTQPEELPFVGDEVNNPAHYCSHPSGIECIEITRHHDFAIGNAIKYLWRAGLKDSENEIQDLEKAVWYIQDKINQLKGN